RAPPAPAAPTLSLHDALPISRARPRTGPETRRRMFVLKLIARNALRHRLRTALTVAGLLVAVIAFGLLQTVIDAWHAGAAAASRDRKSTRLNSSHVKISYAVF